MGWADYIHCCVNTKDVNTRVVVHPGPACATRVQ